MKDSNLRRLSRRIYSPLPLATRATCRVRRGACTRIRQRRNRAPRGPAGRGGSHGRPVVRRREQGRPAGGRQRPQPGGEGALAAVRLPRHRARRSPGRARRRSRIESETEERAKAAVEVFKEKLIKRNISLKAFEAGEPAVSGKTYKVSGKILQGIESDKAKEISKTIRDEKLKGVQAQIQGDQLRVSGKKKDDLQAVIALLKGRDFGIALQFTNYR